MGKEPWIGAETLDWFYHWCRDHGIPGDNRKLQAGIIAGVFHPGGHCRSRSAAGWPVPVLYFSGPAAALGGRERH